ncbi:sulfite oxidase heme-binding subunit YedZ [Gemmatimonadota bacterium]
MSPRIRLIVKVLLFAGLVAPAALAIFRTFTGIYVDPADAVADITGIWTLRLLCLTLMVTPLRRLTGLNDLVTFRRMLGLFAFFYASLHFLTYIGLDLYFRFSILAEDIAERPFITLGFTAFLLMIPLAVTSTKGWIRRLGKRWTVLHRLVYVSAIGGLIHFIWKVKADTDFGEPLLYAAILVILLGYRLLGGWSKRRGGRARTGKATGIPEQV